MATIEATGRLGRRGRNWFYLILSVVLAGVIVTGFSQTVPTDFTHHPGLPLLLHVHGAVFTLWLFVVIGQPALIALGFTGLHRQLGYVSAALAAAMVVMGLAATVFAIRYHFVPSFFPPAIFLVMNSLGIVVFGGLVAAGVALRRRAEWHKRLMLCATVSILGPGLGRFLPMDSFGAAAPLVMFSVIVGFALVGPVADLVTRRRIHPAYFWGVGVIVLSNLLIAPLAFAPPTQTLLATIRG